MGYGWSDVGKKIGLAAWVERTKDGVRSSMAGEGLQGYGDLRWGTGGGGGRRDGWRGGGTGGGRGRGRDGGWGKAHGRTRVTISLRYVHQ